MIHRIILTTAVACLMWGPIHAQDQKGFERVRLRVSSAGANSTVKVDRGKRDLVEVGDRVHFFPRNGKTYRGSVTKVDQRSSLVRMIDRNFVPTPGTRGEVMIPKARIAAKRPKPRPDVKMPVPDRKPPEQPKPGQKQPGGTRQHQPGGTLPVIRQPGHPGWKNQDKDYKQGKPLLSGRTVRPWERPSRLTGLWYLTGNLTQDSHRDFHDSWLRSGGTVDYENVLGYGGAAHFDGEMAYLREFNNRTDADLTVRRLSYSKGGDRFVKRRWEIGRFLQHAVPEFGILDGGEMNFRKPNGDRYGFSVGFMPELDDDMNTWEDSQIAVYYHGVSDLHEQFTWTLAYQKTFHEDSMDRDLVVAKMNYYPDEGWDFHATVWLDFYYGRDNRKPFMEVTNAYVSTGRNWGDDGMRLTYYHSTYPETLRRDFRPPVEPNQLDDDHLDRLTWDTWVGFDDGDRFHATVIGYYDQRDTGGTAEVGYEWKDFWFDNSRLDITPYVVEGSFVTVIGGRVLYTLYEDNGSWDLYYEIANHNVDRFPSDQDDVMQHRIRLSRNVHTLSGWDFTGFGEIQIYDDDQVSWMLGFFLQKSF